MGRETAVTTWMEGGTTVKQTRGYGSPNGCSSDVQRSAELCGPLAATSETNDLDSCNPGRSQRLSGRGAHRTDGVAASLPLHARMRAICDQLKANQPRLIDLWERAIDHEPWILPRQHAQADFVPDVISAIADAILCSPPSRASVMMLAETAARHATARAVEGTDHGRVVLEYYLLRNAVWTYFREKDVGDEEELQAILFVDIAISMATRGALLGYYRSELERQERWEGALDRLVDETPLMWAREKAQHFSRR